MMRCRCAWPSPSLERTGARGLLVCPAHAELHDAGIDIEVVKVPTLEASAYRRRAAS